MFSLSNLSINHIASLSSIPIPQFSSVGVFPSFPNIQFNHFSMLNSITSMPDINKFMIKLPEISNILPIQPKLDISHCTPVYNRDDGPAFTYVLEKNDPVQLNLLKSSHNAISEALHNTDEPIHPFLYAPALKIINDTKKEIDTFCN